MFGLSQHLAIPLLFVNTPLPVSINAPVCEHNTPAIPPLLLGTTPYPNPHPYPHPGDVGSTCSLFYWFCECRGHVTMVTIMAALNQHQIGGDFLCLLGNQSVQENPVLCYIISCLWPHNSIRTFLEKLRKKFGDRKHVHVITTVCHITSLSRSADFCLVGLNVALCNSKYFCTTSYGYITISVFLCYLIMVISVSEGQGRLSWELMILTALISVVQDRFLIVEHIFQKQFTLFVVSLNIWIVSYLDIAIQLVSNWVFFKMV